MRRPLSVFCLMVVSLLILFQILHPPAEGEYAEFDGRMITLSGKVTKKEIKNDYLNITLKQIQISESDYDFQNKKQNQIENAEGVVCRFSLEDETPAHFKLGSYICVSGELKEYTTPTNPGEFDYDFYQKSQRIDFMLKNPTVLAKSDSYNVISEKLYGFRISSEKILEQVLNESEASIMKSILLGNKTEMDSEIKNLFQLSGISHILAISGLHISLIGGLFYKGLKKLGVKTGISAMLSVSLIILYGIMTGMSSSAFRAVFMFSVRVLADVAKRTYDAVTAVSMAAVFLAYENPLLFFTAGLQLSFGAVMGISLLLPVFQKHRGKLLHGPICILLSTFPIMCFHYYTFSTYSLLLNLIVVPVMGFLLLTGLLTLIIGYFSISLAVLPGKIIVLVLLCYEKLSQLSVSLPGSTWTVGKPDLWRIVVYYLALLILAFSYKKLSFPLATAWMSVSFCLVAMKCYPVATVTMLDVGQGDGTVMIDRCGNCITIDGGSSSEKEMGKYTLQPFLKHQGIDRISYAIITHPDEDHYSGILEILQDSDCGIRIEYLVLPYAVKDMKADGTYLQLLELTKEKRVKLLYMKEGDEISFGGLRFQCLWPRAGENYEDVNSSSIVLQVTGQEFCGLFTGDISEKQEKIIAEKLSLQSFTLLKAAHHGSKNSNSSLFLQRVNPEYIWISCGEKNRYGHPHQEALNRMKETNAEIMITTEEGALSLIIR